MFRKVVTNPRHFNPYLVVRPNALPPEINLSLLTSACGARLRLFPDTRICIGCGQPNPDEDHRNTLQAEVSTMRRPARYRWPRVHQSFQDPVRGAKATMGTTTTTRTGRIWRGFPNVAPRAQRQRRAAVQRTEQRKWPPRALPVEAGGAGREPALGDSWTGGVGCPERSRARRRSGERDTTRTFEIERRGDQRGNTHTKVGWANESPKARTPESPSATPSHVTQGESALVTELKNIIERQNAQIHELMSRLEKITGNTQQKETQGHEETPVATTREGPRKMPRKRSPSSAPPKTTQNAETQEMEAEESPQDINQQQTINKKAGEQTRITPGEAAILAALGRLEERITSLEVKHDRLAARVSAMEVRNRKGTTDNASLTPVLYRRSTSDDLKLEVVCSDHGSVLPCTQFATVTLGDATGFVQTPLNPRRLLQRRRPHLLHRSACFEVPSWEGLKRSLGRCRCCLVSRFLHGSPPWAPFPPAWLRCPTQMSRGDRAFPQPPSIDQASESVQTDLPAVSQTARSGGQKKRVHRAQWMALASGVNSRRAGKRAGSRPALRTAFTRSVASTQGGYSLRCV
ncbi:hypothetical protein HPB48_012035 [Haemaphysalis longicornis]|uniref:Uncharacterized protein n=1 Tax=Haemaphysalis longicornis TaxID=44386 RepID=A0A9J6GHA3_HAELO|nr:hypothetical protein HPB48_012035 [Haemaphysalis longicornis]